MRPNTPSGYSVNRTLLKTITVAVSVFMLCFVLIVTHSMSTSVQTPPQKEKQADKKDGKEDTPDNHPPETYIIQASGSQNSLQAQNPLLEQTLQISFNVWEAPEGKFTPCAIASNTVNVLLRHVISSNAP